MIAALLHDIGQIIPLDSTRDIRLNIKGSSENVGRVGHEAIGAEYLRSLGFSETVCRLVNSHVAAKRYVLCVRLIMFRLMLTSPALQISYCDRPELP